MGYNKGDDYAWASLMMKICKKFCWENNRQHFYKNFNIKMVENYKVLLWKLIKGNFRKFNFFWNLLKFKWLKKSNYLKNLHSLQTPRSIFNYICHYHPVFISNLILASHKKVKIKMRHFIVVKIAMRRD